MATLHAADARRLLRFVEDACTTAACGGFRLRTIARLRELVPADMTAWVETHDGRPEVEALASPGDPLSDGPGRFARVRDEHPILRHFERSRRGGAVKLSDFLGTAQLERSPVYQDFFRPAGFAHQMAIALPSRGPRLIRITLNRACGDFSERDRLVLNLVRPHLARAYRAQGQLERLVAERDGLARAADALELGVVTVCGAGRMTYASRSAQRQLARFFPAPRRPAGRLPDDVARWLAMSRRPASRGSDPARAARAFLVEHDGVELEISALRDGERTVLVLRERATRVVPRPLEALGLTPRQAEILAWLAQGKTNFEIATILAISPHTVARHVEAIFERLDVQTRTAAAAAAFARLASG